MSMQSEMISANIRNWLADMAIGAKAMMRPVQIAPYGDDERFKALYETTCYNRDSVISGGIAIHSLPELCVAAGLEYVFVPKEELSDRGHGYPDDIVGHFVCVFNGVKFYTLVRDTDREYKQLKKGVKHDRK